MFPIQNGLKQGRCFVSAAFQLSLGICHREDQENQETLEMNGTHRLLDCADDDVNLLGKTIRIMKKTQKLCSMLVRKVI